MERKRHASLFSGIGGFDLAAEWMGWDNVFQVEISAFCNRVLACQFPSTKRYTDIRDFKTDEYHGTIDIISGGFPCQPFSIAGKRRGSQDDRFLWPEALRVISAIRPRWIVLENVAGLFSILEPASFSRMEIKEVELFCEGKTDGSSKVIIGLQRRIIATILDQIGASGYILPTLIDGTPVISCVPACGVGAPHRRDRIWIVAHTDSHVPPGIGSPLGEPSPGRGAAPQESDTDRSDRPPDTGSPNPRAGQVCGDGAVPGAGTTLGRAHRNAAQPGNRSLPNAHSHGRQRVGKSSGTYPEGWPDEGRLPTQHTGNHWSSWPTQSPVCRRNDGFPGELDGISFSKWRQESLHAFGNAIVPQVAFEIFKAIEVAEKSSPDLSTS